MTTLFRLSLWNAWLLSAPFLALGVVIVSMRKDAARRMADMSGYTARERAVTVAASLAPYIFIIATVWTPLTARRPLLLSGLALYAAGIALSAAALAAILRTPPDEPFSSGPYRFTRNPLYVAATIVFIGICLATANIVLAAYLAVAVLLQHFMILAEERKCREKYGSVFEAYMKRVPRYLFK